MNEKTPIDNKRDALRWFIDHRHENISFEQAIQQMRFAMHGDLKAQAMLDELAAEHHH